MQVISVVAYWTRKQVILRSNPNRVKISYCLMQQPCFVLHCTNNYYIEVLYFSKICYSTSLYQIKWR
jgi:hypothetical protein